MTDTVTASFASLDQVRNADEELIAAGIPRDQIYVDETAKKIRVIVPKAARPGIVDTLERHGLKVVGPTLSPAQA